jgi:hypothetical protein
MASDSVLLLVSLGGLAATVLLVLFSAGFFSGPKVRYPLPLPS